MPDPAIAKTYAFDKVRRALIEEHMWLPDTASENLKRRLSGYSQKRMLLQEITAAAMRYAVVAETSHDDFQHIVLPQAIDIVESMQSGLVETWNIDSMPKRLDFWRHEQSPLPSMKSGNKPHMDRDQIEGAATDYLRLPYRSQAVDRILVDVLISLEMYAFGEQMLQPIPRFARWLPITSPLQQRHTLLQYISGHFWGGLTLLGSAYVALAYLPPLIGETAAGWIAGILAAIFVVALIISTIALPFAWWHQSTSRSKVRKMIGATLSTYAELNSDGVVSAQRIRQVVQKAADEGVIWPGPLYAVLDDNIRRGGLL